MSLQSNTQRTIQQLEIFCLPIFLKIFLNWKCLVAILCVENAFAQCFNFLARLQQCFVFFEEVHCFVSRWNWDGTPQILSWFMQMDLSFVEPGFHFAQTEVYENQDKRMIGKSQHGEGFHKQLGLFPRLLWVRVGTISRRSGVTSFSWSLMHHEPW